MSENTDTKQQNENVGALWARESRNSSQKYLAGHVKLDVDGEEKTVKVVVFKNNHKQTDKHPDYQIYKARPSTGQQGFSGSTESSQAEVSGSDENLL